MNTRRDIAQVHDPAAAAVIAGDDDRAETTPLRTRQDNGNRPMAVRMLLSFVGTMLGLRALTFGQQTHILPVPDVAGGGIHIHHFVWGIVILAVVGYCALMTPDPSSNVRLALLFGIGTALVVDEFALWLTLRDVYFDPEGAWSLELAGAVALTLLGNVVWRFWTGHAAPRTPHRIRFASGAPSPDARVAR